MKLLLLQYMNDEVHLNPEAIEYTIDSRDKKMVEVYLRSGAVLNMSHDAFADLMNHLDGTGDYSQEAQNDRDTE